MPLKTAICTNCTTTVPQTIIFESLNSTKELNTTKLCQALTGYKYCGKELTIELIEKDLEITPPGIPIEQKYYIGFFDNANLVAVMDLEEGYPNSEYVYIGDYAFRNCKKLTSVFYVGLSTDWDSISIGNGNKPLTSATKYYYSETEPLEEGNYWHYDTDGVTSVVWQ